MNTTTTEALTQNNKLIAEFMDCLTIDKDGNIKEDLNVFKYNSSWSLLMDVVQKIEETNFVDEFDIYYDSIYKVQGCTIIPYLKNTFENIQITAPTKIEAIYNAVLKFIEWFNEQKSPQKEK